jgi:hypothetical protein
MQCRANASLELVINGKFSTTHTASDNQKQLIPQRQMTPPAHDKTMASAIETSACLVLLMSGRRMSLRTTWRTVEGIEKQETAMDARCFANGLSSNTGARR